MDEYAEEHVHLTCEIGRFVDQRRKAETAIYLSVHRGRAAKMSWAKIGLALGTSGQAAWEKYGLTDIQRQQRSRQNELGHTQLSLLSTAPGDPALRHRLEPRQSDREQGQDEKA